MKTKRIIGFIAIISILLIALTGCSSSSAATTEPAKVLKVGVCAGPYGDMFTEAIQPSLEEKGYTVEIVEFSDYVQPNKALAAGEIDLNLFQHSTYLANFSKENNLDLTFIKEVPTAAMGIFSEKYKTINDVEDGATVAIPNDATNLSRAIRVLAQTNIITIDPAVDPKTATQNTLSSNPKNLQFVEIEAPQLPRSLDSVGIAVINGNYALSSGLNLSDALYNEKLSEGYINGVAVRIEDKDSDFAKDVIAAIESDAFKKVIEDPTKQYVSFQRPSDY
ncbi:MetQ/NlpA family ABC transporter substrate-binding protein [Acetobacterium wieringae]|uniref:MetQ/NlpA family ABC transporter substrate-binding protein n=1 Tax=Acetobacterium wieringae TaxID=52694 RepID=UPI002B203606|nr:MetQ/NlpA family ABC transporter substrate-binding protein [Acetobacterium wieringae]MEA4806414.1 MetQ/NlpA family ABC transporter substrate-binding protein [Acetobacterium wieringae]